MTPAARHPDLLRAADAALLIVDIQGRLARLVPHRDQVIATTLRLIRLAQIYGLPIGLTEQNRDKFGHTEAPILAALSGEGQGTVAVNKFEFSACASPDARTAAIDALQRPQIVLVGMETHICILQTALDLLHAGWQVHVVTDGVGSRSEATHQNGLERMARAGCVLTNWESVCYEVAYAAGDDRFRRVLNEIMKADFPVPPVAEAAG
ncbi:MAG: putative hydrolase YcaC [bacterium]|nr:putative hydrolase YcaC [bacterium]